MRDLYRLHASVPAPPKGKALGCSACGKIIKVRDDGTLLRHRALDGTYECEGSRQAPVEVSTVRKRC